MKFNVTQEEFKNAVNSKEQKRWFRSELNKFDTDMSNTNVFHLGENGGMKEIKPTRMSNIPKELIPSAWCKE